MHGIPCQNVGASTPDIHIGQMDDRVSVQVAASEAALLTPMQAAAVIQTIRNAIEDIAALDSETTRTQNSCHINDMARDRVWVLRLHKRVTLREAHAITDINWDEGFALTSCGLKLGPREIGDVPPNGCMPCERCVAATPMAQRDPTEHAVATPVIEAPAAQREVDSAPTESRSGNCDHRRTTQPSASAIQPSGGQQTMFTVLFAIGLIAIILLWIADETSDIAE